MVTLGRQADSGDQGVGIDDREAFVTEFKIGALCWNQYADWPSLLQAGIRADELGYTSLWTWDELQPSRHAPVETGRESSAVA